MAANSDFISIDKDIRRMSFQPYRLEKNLSGRERLLGEPCVAIIISGIVAFWRYQ